MEDNCSSKPYRYNLRRRSQPDARGIEPESKVETIVLSDNEEKDDQDEQSLLGACGAWASSHSDHSYSRVPVLSDSSSASDINSPGNTSSDYPQSVTCPSNSPRSCSSPTSLSTSSKSCAGPSSPGVLECAICLQTCVHPARLPCEHIFCFLCLKGIAHGRGTCALCRRPIPPDYLDHPDIIPDRLIPASSEEDPPQDNYAWYYEGRNGWWQYDWRTSGELETGYSRGDSSAEVLIAGYVYLVSFEDMIQCRKANPARRRAIKRDLISCPKKGIAGLRTNSSTVGDENSATSLSQAMANLNLDQV